MLLPIFFLLIMAFLVLFPLFYNAVECLVGLAIIATGLPVYLLMVAWNNKPLAYQTFVGKWCVLYYWLLLLLLTLVPSAAKIAFYSMSLCHKQQSLTRSRCLIGCWMSTTRSSCRKFIYHNQNLILTFRSHREIFIRRSWYSVLPSLGARISCHIKKVVVGVTQLITDLPCGYVRLPWSS